MNAPSPRQRLGKDAGHPDNGVGGQSGGCRGTQRGQHRQRGEGRAHLHVGRPTAPHPAHGARPTERPGADGPGGVHQLRRSPRAGPICAGVQVHGLDGHCHLRDVRGVCLCRAVRCRRGSAARSHERLHQALHPHNGWHVPHQLEPALLELPFEGGFQVKQTDSCDGFKRCLPQKEVFSLSICQRWVADGWGGGLHVGRCKRQGVIRRTGHCPHTVRLFPRGLGSKLRGATALQPARVPRL
mmetsp:Transcript_107312/g.303483  ORF Transcript_107312/g.303483 Transcript_107312/m.303483 type:complete len:241 (+) Transcript_107312:30-752(+)